MVICAGARSLVVSNWDVSDDGTADLMSKLFDGSSKHPELSHGEALQQAELAMIAQARNDDELHPRYWGPFVVVVEPLSQSPESAAIRRRLRKRRETTSPAKRLRLARPAKAAASRCAEPRCNQRGDGWFDRASQCDDAGMSGDADVRLVHARFRF